MAETGNLTELVRAAKRVYIIGNGGSYANAMHIANDLISCGIRAYTLDPSTLTMFANDHGYAHIYSMWLRVMGERGDLLIALSGSGRSPNILKAIKEAEDIGMDVATVFGVPKYGMQEAEERQIVLGHDLMRSLRGNRC